MLLSLLLFSGIPTALGYELATEISKNENSATISSIGYAKLGLIKIQTNLRGLINLKGNVSVRGTANLVLWAKVEGNYYFSKLPGLQGLKDKENHEFKIPFNAADKTVTEIILEVELLSGGTVNVIEPAVTKG